MNDSGDHLIMHGEMHFSPFFFIRADPIWRGKLSPFQSRTSLEFHMPLSSARRICVRHISLWNDILCLHPINPFHFSFARLARTWAFPSACTTYVKECRMLCHHTVHTHTHMSWHSREYEECEIGSDAHVPEWFSFPRKGKHHQMKEYYSELRH